MRKKKPVKIKPQEPEFLTEEELNELIRDFRESEVLMTGMMRNSPYVEELQTLYNELHKVTQGTPEYEAKLKVIGVIEDKINNTPKYSENSND